MKVADALVIPLRRGDLQLHRQYLSRIVRGRHTTHLSIDDRVAVSAAELRARYNLRLIDSFQTAVAIHSACDALLTNDSAFRRINEVRAILIDDLPP
jgi:predicted nucleic acid-binding protein